jgi:hypothetical protein
VTAEDILRGFSKKRARDRENIITKTTWLGKGLELKNILKK